MQPDPIEDQMPPPDPAATELGDTYLDLQAAVGRRASASIKVLSKPFAEAIDADLSPLPGDELPDDLPTAERLVLHITELNGFGEQVAAIVRMTDGAPIVRQISGEPEIEPTTVDFVRRILKPRSPEPANDNRRGPGQRDRFKLTWFDDIRDDHRKDWIVKDVLGKGEFSVVSGKPGSGKSVILGDLACHIASGMEWHGRRVERGLVIYVAAERRDLTERRFLAFRKRHDVRDIPLLVLGGSIDFTRDTADAAALVQAVKQAEQQCGMPCQWIVVDTLTRVFGGGDQNASKDMTRLIRSIDTLMHGTGAHITIVHHTGWETDRAKGAIDLDGAVDASFIVANTGTAYNLRCDGANDGPEGSITNFGLELVQIGTDEDGEPTMAPVAVPREGKAKILQSGGPKGIAAAVLSALRDTIAEVGIEPEGDHFPGDILAVTEDQWRERFYTSSASLPQDTVRKQFQRGVKSLRDTNTVAQIGQWCWPS